MSKSVVKTKGKPDLSIIVSMYNEEESLGLFFKTIKKTLVKIKKYTYEIICIDDGSVDKTYSLLEKYAKEDECIKIIKFSRNFGKEYGIMAGLKFCSGRCAIPMDVDLQDPPELILDFIKKWEEGYDMVYGIRSDRGSDTFLKRWTAKLFYNLDDDVEIIYYSLID